ncbi:MAG: S41 family peptidase [Bacteroidales bacterium]|nr:S41 family peptidase [Bacteroidales bacterium]
MKKAIFPIALALTLAIGILLGHLMTNNAQTYTVLNQQTHKDAGNKVTELLEILSEAYVDSLEMDSIAESIVPLIMQQLDPHSVYISSQDIQAVSDELSASFVGIGIQYNMMTDTVYIVNIIKGGPSEKAGLLPDDKILMVDTFNLAGQKRSNNFVQSHIKGEKGTVAHLTVQRPNVDSLLHINVTRDDIISKSIDASYMIDDVIGYVNISKFSESTYKEFLHSLASLKRAGMKKLIIDLRGNGGGYMEPAVNMLNELVRNNTLLVYMEGNKTKRREWIANGSGSSINTKLIVLIDEFSASASEIFAGAIQDNDRGLIVGRRSFGKGLVQTEFPFRDGSAVRMTIARYYTPSGRCIQKPYTMGKSEDYAADILNRYMHGEFFHADSIHQNDSTIYHTVGGRTVYGGGGIMPDIFVPRDTSKFTPYSHLILNNSLHYKFSRQHLAQHRNEYQTLKNGAEMEKYLLSHHIMDEFFDYCDKNDLPLYKKDYEIYKDLIVSMVIGQIIRNYFDDNEYYIYVNKTDETVLKAIELFKQ